MNVMAGITREETAEDYEYYSVKLGALTGDDYTPDIVSFFMDVMNGGGEVSYYSNRSEEFGYVYTGAAAVRNSAGTPVAVLSIDLNMDDISRVWHRYMIGLAVEILILV